jgi:hypothetical protein
MIPARFAPIPFGLMLSGVMSLIISGVSTARAMGLGPEFPGQWLIGWLSSWPVAFSAVLVAGPMARKIVARLTKAG